MAVYKTQKFIPRGFDGDVVWLESAEGPKAGLQFGVKTSTDQMKKLTPEKVATITVKSLNNENTAWTIDEIHDKQT